MPVLVHSMHWDKQSILSLRQKKETKCILALKTSDYNRPQRKKHNDIEQICIPEDSLESKFGHNVSSAH